MATISYYDNVKDNVKNKGGENGSSFDTLKKAAQEHSENEDKEDGDGTSIEILEDGLQQKQRATSGSSGGGSQKQTSNQTESNPMVDSGSSEQSSAGTADMNGVEEKLDKIIEQNQRMIEILESFGS